VFAVKLLPVLLFTIPSVQRACTLILLDDLSQQNKRIKSNKKISQEATVLKPHQLNEPESPVPVVLKAASSGGGGVPLTNIHAAVFLTSLLTPVYTVIPFVIAYQFLARYQQGYTALHSALHCTRHRLLYEHTTLRTALQCDHSAPQTEKNGVK
jgi:hypothetical protein